MAGCLLALCVGLPRFEAFYQRFARYWWVLPIYYWGISYYLDVRFFPTYTFTFGYTLDALATARSTAGLPAPPLRPSVDRTLRN